MKLNESLSQRMPKRMIFAMRYQYTQKISQESKMHCVCLPSGESVRVRKRERTNFGKRNEPMNVVRRVR